MPKGNIFIGRGSIGRSRLNTRSKSGAPSATSYAAVGAANPVVTVLADYSSTYQSTNTTAGQYAEIELNLATADVGSGSVTTAPFEYTAPADEIVAAVCSARYTDSDNLSHAVLALSVNGADVAPAFAGWVHDGSRYLRTQATVALLEGATLRAVLRVRNVSTDTQEILIDQARITVSTTTAG